MENAVNEIIRLRMEKTKNALENNNMTAYTVKTKEEAADIVRSLLKKETLQQAEDRSLLINAELQI